MIKNKLRIYCDANNVLRSGFRRDYSWTTALLNIIDDILAARVLMILVFSNALGIINYKILVAKLHYIDVKRLDIDMLESYFHNVLRYNQIYLYADAT